MKHGTGIGAPGRMARTIALAALAAGLALGLAAPAQAQKSGGVLRAMLRENWPSMSIHEEATISAVWPLMPVYSNLVLPDPARPTESADHLVGELAESWSWSKDFRKLTFKLRRGVTWHDGKPFTSTDVKTTFDTVRNGKLKLNPRKGWYENVASIDTAGDYEVVFNLKKPEPGLLTMLASGYSPVYPAHVSTQDMRTHAVGTGPFMIKTVRPDEELVVVRNPNYFVKGRPYLDGIDFIEIKERSARTAALVANQLDIAFPGEGTSQIRDQLMKDAPAIVLSKVAQSVNVNLLLNTQKPPFNDLRLRQAVNLAMDRETLNKTVYQGVLMPGGAMLPQPYGEFGLSESDLRKLPGWGDPAKDKAEARKLLAEAGYGPNHPLTVTVSTRAIAIYVDVAIWVIDQLKQVGIEATLAQFETGVWHPKLARREYEIATNLTGIGSSDPDANLFENFACGSQRNYTDYCTKEMQALIEKQSEEPNPARRLELVHEIDRKLQVDAARPILGHLVDFYAEWPYVKGLVPHHNVYNYGRMQDVWLDK
jgi:peptide/nickel transport system substrate-binding protein